MEAGNSLIYFLLISRLAVEWLEAAESDQLPILIRLPRGKCLKELRLMKAAVLECEVHNGMYYYE